MKKIHVAMNERLARQLRQRFNHDQRQSGEQVWEAPEIYSLGSWIRDWWASTWPAEVLLHEVQHYALWVAVVEKDRPTTMNETNLASARQAMQAAQLAKLAGLEPHALTLPSADVEVMMQWAGAVKSKLDANGWVVESDLPSILLRWLSEGAVEPPHILLHGLKDLAPAHRALIEQIVESGGSAEWLDPSNPSSATWLTPSNPAAELAWVADECAALLAPHQEDPERAPRIAVLVPDIESQRHQILREFRRAFQTSTGRAPWRLAPGDRLLKHPKAASALRACTVSLAPQSTEWFSSWLLESASPETREAAANLELILRRRPQQKMSFRSLLALSEREPQDSPSMRELRQRWQTLLDLLEATPNSALPSAWAVTFENTLQLMRWHSAVESEWYQAEVQVLTSLNLLAAFDRQSGPITRARAVFYWKELMAKPFQAMVDYDQPIEVIGYWEAAGMQFDHWFITGASSSELPPKPQQLGYIDNERLSSQGLSTASPAGMHQRATRWAHLILQSGGTSVWSCPMTDAQGVERSPTGLAGITALQRQPFEPRYRPKPLIARIWREVDPFPPHPLVDKPGELQAATTILTQMAASPALAFWRQRLGIERFPNRVYGLSERTQGNLVHGVLMRFWQEVKSQSNLLLATPQECRETLLKAIRDTWHGMIGEVGHLGPIASRVEQRRIERVVHRFLQLEAQRKDLFTVIAVEGQVIGRWEHLQFSLRLDRVDAIDLPSGPEVLVMDYKTGAKADPKDWLPESLKQPQLPLYVTSASEGYPHPVGGVAFGHLSPREQSFKGITTFKDDLFYSRSNPHESAKFRGLLSDWEVVIGSTFRQYLRGHQALNPDVLKRGDYHDDLACFNRQDLPPLRGLQ